MTSWGQLIGWLRHLVPPSSHLKRLFGQQPPTAQRLCVACAHVGVPTRQMAGRSDVELALWGIVVMLAVIYFADRLILAFYNPWALRVLLKVTSMAGKVFIVLSMAYTLIRFSIQTDTCPKCGGSPVIPLDSPRAREILGPPGAH